MKVIYTRHAQVDKFLWLKRHNFKVTKKDIRQVLANPEHEDKESDTPKIIASKSIGPKYVLRVVYRIESDKIIVITFYPAEKGRYY